MIKVGDRVKFINDTGTGIVKSIKNTIAMVDVEDGFEMPVVLTELVVVDKEEELRAIEKIGVGASRPGTSPKKRGEKEKKEPLRQAAFARYGKVSLVEADDQEEEDILDLYAIKEQYLRSMAAMNNKQIEMQEQNDQSVFDVPAKPSKQPATKPRQVALEQLDVALGVEIEKTPAQPISRPLKKEDDGIEVIDLHATEVLPSSEGLSAHEILSAQMARFDVVVETALKSGLHGKIVFIHGVGKGKLKYEIKKCLDLKYPKLGYQDASFREYGYGAIMVFY